jgi:hypothetical protein
MMRVEPGLNPFWHQASLPHRLLSFPSLSRIWTYIERSASTNPWAIQTEVEPVIEQRSY